MLTHPLWYAQVKFASQFGSFIAPMLGLTRVSEHLTIEVNRLASQCTGKDGVGASAFLNFANGMAYGGKGELRQAAGFFAAAAKVSLELRDLQEWANNLSYCRCTVEGMGGGRGDHKGGLLTQTPLTLQHS